MKKMFTSFLASGSVASLVATCGQVEAKPVAKETKIEEQEALPAIIKGTVHV